MSDESVCPCEGIHHPIAVDNPPGLPALAYCAGTFGSFREALLQGLPGERDLRGYRPTADGDLALQVLEWWAYLADILTFYNERAANASYLRTALFDVEVARLVRLLGHRRRPGVGASATLAALVNAKVKITLPAGLPVQSKPGPGQEPQVFEVFAATDATPGGAIPVDPVVSTSPSALGHTLLLQGTVTSVKVGDHLLFGPRGSTTASHYQWVGVVSVAAEKDLRGRPRTRITLDAALRGGGDVKSYRLMRSDTATGLFAYPNAAPEPHLSKVHVAPALALQHLEPDKLVDGITEVTIPAPRPSTAQVSLASPLRTVEPNEPIVVGDEVAIVQSYHEAVANIPLPPTTATTSAAGKPTTSISVTASMAIPHGVLKLSRLTTTPDATKDRVRSGFRDVGVLVDGDPPVPLTGSTISLTPVAPAAFPSIADGALVLLEEATGAGALGKAIAKNGTLEVTAASSAGFSLTPPLRLLFNLVRVTRGKTVKREPLGSGDATVPAQSFALSKSPLTYLQPQGQASGALLQSTLRVHVDGVEWKEVPSFYDQAPDAQVFVTREDDEQRTHVLFGDGVHGARLPSGTSNVIAAYRHGSGAAVPDAGALATLLQPFPGLQAVRSPVPPAGGADPEPAANMRRWAPQSTLALGRAVSADDYEAIASLAPGVTRAHAEFAWDPGRRRALVTIWVSGDADVEQTVIRAIAAVADPNRPFRVVVATAYSIQLELEVVRDRRHADDAVKAALEAALLDDDTGLFGTRRLGIGQAVYRSQIHRACLDVPGVLAVHGVALGALEATSWSPEAGGFFALTRESLHITITEATDAG